MAMYSRNIKIISCLCGGVRLKTKGTFRHVTNCHCTQCMKTHGNFAAYTSTPEKDVKFLKKRTLKWFRSSKKAKRGFCTRCGASMFFKWLGSEDISIAAGMFNNPTKLKTKTNIFIKGKLDYYKLDNKLPKFSRYSK